jgi:hypothetical protein
MGELEQAMETFPMGGNAMTSFDDIIDTITFAVRAVERLVGNLRGIVQQHAAAA